MRSNSTKHADTSDKSEADKQALMKDVVKDLFRRETSWWNTLTDKDKSKLFPGWEPSSGDDPLGYICMSGDVALVLAGIKPCAIATNIHHEEYGQLFYDHVLRPWYDKHLGDSGSILGSFVCEMTNPMVALYAGREKGKPVKINFDRGALFRNLNDPNSDRVKRVFSATHPVDRNNEVACDELRVCFGYPGRLPDLKNAVDVTYRFQKPETVFNMDVTCAICIKYHAKNVDAATVGKHFRKCRHAMKTFGYSISLDMEDLDNSGWSAKDIALAWFEAAGQDARECFDMIEEDVIVVRDSGIATKSMCVEIVQYIDMFDNMMKRYGLRGHDGVVII